MSAILDAPRHHFSRAEYERMINAEIFGPNDHLELLDGEIIDATGVLLPPCVRYAVG